MNGVGCKPLLLWASFLAELVPCAQAAERADFLSRLPANQATESGGQVYVRVQGQRRGSAQALERLLIGRATVIAGHWLCDYTPRASQRLNTNLQGVNLVHAQEAEGVMEIVIKLKKQKPECKVQSTVPRPGPVPSPLASTLPTSEPAHLKVPQPPESTDAGFTKLVYPKGH